MVAYNYQRGLQIGDQPETNNPPSINRAINDSQIEGDTQASRDNEHLPLLRYLFDTSMDLYKHVKDSKFGGGQFKLAKANAQYYSSLLVDKIQRLDGSDVQDPVYGKVKEGMLQELRDIESQVPEWEYQHTCYCMLYERSDSYDYATSIFFFVLPSDLGSWDDSDPPTHQFRLYFLCNNGTQKGGQEDLPQILHLSNHPGYNIKRPQQLLQDYGYHMLRVLIMVKRGLNVTSFGGWRYELPPLETFEIFWDCDPRIVGSHLTKDNITPLVDKAIAHLQELSPPKWKVDLWLNPTQSAAVKAHLDVQGGDNGESNLCRYHSHGQRVYWRCEAHAYQYIDYEYFQRLKEFVLSHAGHVDMQQITLKVELGSEAEADRFRNLLLGTKHVFDVFLKLNWRPTRLYLQELCMDIAKTNTMALEIDGVTPDVLPQSLVQYADNIFCDVFLAITKLAFVTLHNYPRPQEQCRFFGSASLHSTSSVARFAHRLVELRDDLYTYTSQVSSARTTLDFNTTVGELSAALERYGLLDVTQITRYNYKSNTSFDLKKRAYTEAYLRDAWIPDEILAPGSLQKMTVDLEKLKFDQDDFFRLVQNNTELQELNISYRRQNILHHIEYMIKIWLEAPCSFSLTLVDRMRDSRGHVVAQLATRGIDVNGGDTIPLSCQQQAMDAPEALSSCSGTAMLSLVNSPTTVLRSWIWPHSSTRRS